MRVGVGDGLLHDLEQVAVLAAQIDEAHLRADGEAGDHGAFDDGVRVCRKMTWSLQVPGSDSSPLTRTYFGFSRLLGHERPLHAGGEACAAAPAQAGGLHGR